MITIDYDFNYWLPSEYHPQAKLSTSTVCEESLSFKVLKRRPQHVVEPDPQRLHLKALKYGEFHYSAESLEEGKFTTRQEESLE